MADDHCKRNEKTKEEYLVNIRSATVSGPEEPCAGKPHAGIYEGAVGQLAVLP